MLILHASNYPCSWPPSKKVLNYVSNLFPVSLLPLVPITVDRSWPENNELSNLLYIDLFTKAWTGYKEATKGKTVSWASNSGAMLTSASLKQWGTWGVSTGIQRERGTDRHKETQGKREVERERVGYMKRPVTLGQRMCPVCSAMSQGRN